MGIIDAHPALEAASPQAPVADWFVGDDFHHNGAFYLAHAFRFFSRVGQQLEHPTRQQLIPFDYGTPDGYEFYLNVGPLANIDRNHFKGRIAFWQELMEHGVYDEFWKARNILPHLKNITPAVMTVGGWFDAEDLYGPLNIYQSVEQGSPGVSNTIRHGAVGARRLAQQRWREARPRLVQPKDSPLLPDADRAAVLPAPPEGR